MEVEIDTLIKLTREDLWSRDLDDFINEWRTQLQEESNMRKKLASMGRRASSKLNINAKVPGRKRKGQGEDPDDSDFGTKAAARKAAPVKRAQPKATLLSQLSPLAKPAATKKPTASSKAGTLGAKTSSILSEDVKPPQLANDASSSFDGAPTSDLTVAPIFHKMKAATVSKKIAPAKKVTSEVEDDDDDEADEVVIRPLASRKPREAAKKVPIYNLDDSDSNGDDMLLDVGKMVKGIGNASSDQATAARPLFPASMSRPGSSAGLPKKSSSLARQTMEVDGDDTDYSKLAPPPAAKRGISVTSRRTVISDDDVNEDEDDEILPISRKSPPPKATSTNKAHKAVAKPATKAKPKASIIADAKKSTKQATTQPPKKMALSPAANAYAAKRLKIKPAVPDDSDDEDIKEDGEDEVEKVANAILDEGNDDGEDEGEDDDQDEAVVFRRPARRVAAQAAKKVTKAWGGDSEAEEEENDDDDMEDDDSAMFDDDEESE